MAGCLVVFNVQNIEISGAPHLLGSDLAAELNRQGFRGLVCILTGSSKRVVDELSVLPGVDLVRVHPSRRPTDRPFGSTAHLLVPLAATRLVLDRTKSSSGHDDAVARSALDPLP